MPGVDLEQLERLFDFMATHGLEEFEYEHAGLHIRLKRAAAGHNSQPGGMAAHAMAAELSSGHASSLPSVVLEAPPPSPAAPATEELHVIKSPIVGTFYLAPSPEAPPYVKVGDTIQAGQVVCIVEAMKLMNEIEADVAGEVAGILAENGQPVEYGQSLFAVRPAKKK
jgi:acetyl-CoA carboxylase biotin carboxyl carrier protein